VEKTAETSTGKVRGTASGGVVRYLGVPYAAAPVGDLRFAKPEPHAPWLGIWDATVRGPSAPYAVKPFPGLDATPLIGEGWVQGDEYLNANIWRPDSDASGLPVMVFIHGGGFIVGSNSASIHDGSGFARSGVVCIAINYRMGIDGFLPIPGVPTNLGLRDMIAALIWARANAAAFGGDPNNVTVFGESAGAMAIADLITSPLAKGLFRRAIIQSGHGNMTRDISMMQRLVKKLAKFLKVTPDAAGFRGVPAGDALKAVEKVSCPPPHRSARHGSPRSGVRHQPFRPRPWRRCAARAAARSAREGRRRRSRCADRLQCRGDEPLSSLLRACATRSGKWLATYVLTARSRARARC
jgi:para-nitrobenzyl esterase